ncbi:MAG TPA: PQQ-dependent sugar dehydrogenase, partial [Ramlibacter sp.]
MNHRFAAPLAATVLVASIGAALAQGTVPGVGPNPQLPAPAKRLLPTVNIAPAEGWPQGTTPRAAAGFKVTALASGLQHPRWVYTLPNGDVLVAESNSPKPKEGSKNVHAEGVRGKAMEVVMKRAGAGVPSADRITLLRDADGDGVAEVKQLFLGGLTSPFGMALVGKELFIANADAIVKVPYEAGQTSVTAAPVKVTDLPSGANHHWTKNIIASADGSKLYATVGSNSNIGDNGMAAEEGRAAIWEVDRATGNKRLFASGLRNPNGLGWEPQSKALWTVVNERDELGNDLVPDYLTSVQDGAFYGWPWSYWGKNVDTRVKPPNPQMVAKAIAP